MGQDYCICQGVFNKEQESHLLSSNRGQIENSRKKNSLTHKENPSEKETSTDSKNNNKLKFENKDFSFKDMAFLGENYNQNFQKLKNNYIDNKNDIKEEDDEDEISNKNSSNNINFKNKKEYKSYHSSKEFSSNLTGNNKNKKHFLNFDDKDKENKSDDNSKNEDKKEEESISADFLLNDLKIGNKDGNGEEGNSENNNTSNENEDENYYSLGEN